MPYPCPMHEDLKERITGVFPQLVDILERLVRIPSVSAPGFPPEAVRRSAEAVAGHLRDAGFGDVRLLELEGAHPAVYGHIPAPPGAPTVLLYAHHDVQPPGPAEQWTSGPFDPSIVSGRLYGRGVSDDKSGIIMHLGAVMAFDGALPVGVKVFVEGEEEIGSAHLDGFLARHGELLEADVIVIGDSSNWRVGQPALTTSLRGLVAVGVEVRTAENAVHSGMYGGVFPDALMCLARLLATLHDDDGNVAVAGILHEESEPLDLTEAELRAQLGAVPGLETLGSGSLTGRLWSKPAISVLAIDAPPLSEAINQLVPRAAAKVSMRIPPGQDPTAAMNALRSHLVEHAPWGADVTVTGIEAGAPFRLATEGAAFEAWRSGMNEAWGTEPVDVGVGGSIPFVASFNGRFPDAAILLTGPGDPTSAFHAPNESQDLAELERAVVAQAVALRLLGAG
jgi:cysteinylglycine-S-conjugate dipeptidase